jgi:hypothetical protein
MIATDAGKILNEMAVVTATKRGKRLDDFISINPKAKEEKYFKTKCAVHAKFAGHDWKLNEGFSWNGADIPRLLEWLICLITGLTRFDPRLAIATGFHDSICNALNAANVQRVIGDAIFISLLMDIELNGERVDGIGSWRATVLYLGVRFYSGLEFITHKHK